MSGAITRPTEIVYQWWSSLTSERSGRRRAALARMRRAHTPIEVIQEPEALRLIGRLHRIDADRVATIAGVLAFVHESEDRPLARSVGRRSLDDDQSARLSEARFRRLLQTDARGLMEQMRRVVRLNKGRANVENLAAAILYWGDRVRKEWIFEYYAVAASQHAEYAPSIQTEE